jgi:hypothetical protein
MCYQAGGVLSDPTRLSIAQGGVREAEQSTLFLLCYLNIGVNESASPSSSDTRYSLVRWLDVTTSSHSQYGTGDT